MEMAKHKHPIFLKSIIGVAGMLSFGIYLFQQGMNKKEDFNKAKGQIIYYSSNYLDLPYENVKYLKINTYPRVFQLWTPTLFNANDTSRLFKYDELNLGDSIDIYFRDNKFESDQRVNRGMRYIDKNKIQIYFVSSSDKVAGLSFIGISLMFLLGLIILKQKGKII